jgi:hypothetical protein
MLQLALMPFPFLILRMLPWSGTAGHMKQVRQDGKVLHQTGRMSFEKAVLLEAGIALLVKGVQITGKWRIGSSDLS